MVKMHKCIDCGKPFDPQLPGSSPFRGPICNKKYLEAWTIPGEVNSIVQELDKANFPVYLVGGSVRDYLLGRKIKDYDLVTSAKTEELEKIFPKSLEVGKQFGVVKVPVPGDVVEIATFREDGTYSDGRRPDFIKEGTMATDVQRRDFTINGLLFDLKTKEVIDQTGGLNDLNLKQIKCIGNPLERFQEDHLRVLRALRFATVLDFTIEKETFAAVKADAKNLSLISKERIKTELDKMFDSPNLSAKANLIKESKVLDYVFPHFTEGKKSALFHKLSKIRTPSKELVYSWIFRQDTKLMNEYKMHNDEIKQIVHLDKIQHQLGKFEGLSLSEQNQLLLEPKIEQTLTAYQDYEEVSPLVLVRKQELVNKPINVSLLTSGKELIDYGFNPGPKMGRLIKTINSLVLGREIKSAEEKKQFILSQQ
jgi:tRNA nucleotidyltransferase/poly(A) polymerase